MAIIVYLVDDDEDDRELFKSCIKLLKADIEVFLFKDGDDLMQSIKKNTLFFPNIIFLDINMPRKNGHECLRELRSDVHYKNMPIIMLTTSNDETDINMAYENNASLYVKKMASFSQQIETLKHIFHLYYNGNLVKSSKEEFVIMQAEAH